MPKRLNVGLSQEPCKQVFKNVPEPYHAVGYVEHIIFMLSFWKIC